MQIIFILFALLLISCTQANLSGPYLLWGNEKVINLQPRALVEANENDFADLFRDVKAIVVFVRNNTKRLDGKLYPKFQELVKHNAWTYLPQRSLAVDPFDYNANIEVINLSGSYEENDSEIISGYADALAIYGDGEVLGILAGREEDAHFLSKREAKEGESLTDESHTTTVQPLTDETEETFIYVADGRKAILYLTSAPELNISRESFVLKEHNKAVTFDDQKAKGYGRLNIIFKVGDEKLFLRFNFTLKRGTWYMKAVEVEHRDYKDVLRLKGGEYNIPSAPVGFSYRCSSRSLVFTNGTDILVLKDYQVQPWLNGLNKFGDVYDCVGFTTAPIWAGIVVTILLCTILTIGLLAILDIKTPNRFESSRSKQLTFAVQD